MSKFFINRPIFAMVIALFIILTGVVSYYNLPREAYPNIAPPTISIKIVYPGASAQTIDENVVSVIDDALIGISGLDHTDTTSDSAGSGEIKAVFSPGTDADIAGVQIQNRIAQIQNRLPAIVRTNGVVVNKNSSDFLELLSFTSTRKDGLKSEDLGDWVSRVIAPQISRVPGVSSTQVFASPKAMRIWLDPVKMRALEVSTFEIQQAINQQNTYLSGGTLGGAPMLSAQKLLLPIEVPSILQNEEDFRNIIVKTTQDGQLIRLKDVARVELGQRIYQFTTQYNGAPNAPMMVQKNSEANAIDTAAAVKKTLDKLAPSFPAGVKYTIPFDSSTFVKISINKVQHTLIEAFILVAIVMLLFLHHVRYALIPILVVPISILAANTALLSLGMSINILTMFAMVLVVGIVVDDAIVVVENIERLMKQEKLSPKEATFKAMKQISGAIVGITLVLVAVFLPMALFSGSTGAIYKQFSAVTTVSIAVSGFIALTLTPALCVLLLKPIQPQANPVPSSLQKNWLDHLNIRSNQFFTWFEKQFDHLSTVYVRLLDILTARFRWLLYSLYVLILLLIGIGFFILPTGFLPNEDQKILYLFTQLTHNAKITDTEKVLNKYSDYLIKQPGVDSVASVAGFSFLGTGENYGIAFISLEDWSKRTGKELNAFTLAKKFTEKVMKDQTSFSLVVSPPAIPSLGTSDQLQIMIEDRGNLGYDALTNARLATMGAILSPAGSHYISSPQPGGKGKQTVLRVNINKDVMMGNGVKLSAVQHALTSYISSFYINDFPYKGKMQQVILQADAKGRKNEQDLMSLTVPTTEGKEIPLSTFATYTYTEEPANLTRHNGFPSLSLNFSTKMGTGIGMKVIEKIAQTVFPHGIDYDWTGIAAEQEKAGNQSFILYLLSIVVVFLCLAALYESWALPFIVLFSIPLGMFGIIIGASLTGLSNDLYFKIGLIAIMGLTAKNAILIVEFARSLKAKGKSATQAALEAAHLRFRPIIMTSIAFIVGSLPLMFSKGASSSAQNEIGAIVFFGMLIGTFLALFLVPTFFILIENLSKKRIKKQQKVKVQ